MKLICAGGYTLKNGESFTDLVLRVGLGKLLSHYSEINHINKYNGNDPIMIDSGGHVYNKASGINVVGHKSTTLPRPAKEEAERLMRFIDKNKHKNWVFVETDFYGQLSLSYIDGLYNEVMSMGGNFKFMRVYHPDIPGDEGTLKTLKKWIDQGQDYIGVSKSASNYYGRIFNMTKTDVKLHGFAVTGITVLEKYPFYSGDSTTSLLQAIKNKAIAISPSKYLSKEDAIKNKDVRYIQYPDDDSKIIKSLIEFKKREEHLTRLWTKRGVTWNE